VEAGVLGFGLGRAEFGCCCRGLSEVAKQLRPIFWPMLLGRKILVVLVRVAPFNSSQTEPFPTRTPKHLAVQRLKYPQTKKDPPRKKKRSESNI
jgi:hypothetical protein